MSSEIHRSSVAAQAPDHGLIGRLVGRLGVQGLLTDASDKAPFEASARHGRGVARAVVRPASTEELAWVVQELVGADASFVVQGAATGLVGAATPSDRGTQWVVSTQRLRNRLEIDPVNRSAIVAAGYRLSDVNRAAAEHGLTFPIDLGADPSIGGMVATNTGGSRLIRYGGVRENVLAVAGVLANPPGARVGSTHGLRKNNIGLDWTQLMTGTFGAFGVVTHATLKLHPVQRQTATALAAVESAEMAMELLCSFEGALGEFVSAFEGMSGNALNAAVKHLPSVAPPFQNAPPYAVLLEVSSAVSKAAGLDLESILLGWLEAQVERAMILDAVVDKPERLWRIRHAISESVQALGKLVAFDVAVSRSRFAAFRARAIELIAAEVASALVCDFGHLGDGGMHLNIVVPPGTRVDAIAELRAKLYQAVVEEFDGSFSAEHGIGPYNQAFYRRFTDQPTRALAGALHVQLDPYGQLGNVRLD
ncbi:FAD-binding oxidoreductase [Variovorax soli]|uniref:FAD/FMN-containing dehydrogenase n=1 Tax=Variovorax soli TaxID=376815 RepID=A0ABU1NMJ5_9BURK|nr:FAD-binding oxidoreductase [Variovorax soli]MDR6539265.1 FAD/FMN-containing dehydrogenase [Variovorax soli]